MNTLVITLQELTIGNLDPYFEVTRVVIQKKDENQKVVGEWTEAFGSKAELRAFHRGMLAKEAFPNDEIPLGFGSESMERHIIEIATEDLSKFLEAYK